MPAIEVCELTKCFGELAVLQGVEMRLPELERLAVLGSSGAGKSTLLRILAGLETPDAGSFALDGEDLTRRSPERRGLAMMSQDYALYPQLNVRKNLETALLSLRLSRDETASRCNEAMARFRIEHLSGQLPSQLSGGQAQRVALAKALIRRPRLLLLDEPFSQLDGPLRDELRDLVSEMVQHYQTSLIFVTHDPLDAMRLATHVAILHTGRIMQLSTPSVVYQSPQSRVAAELMSPWGVNWLQADGLGECGDGRVIQALRETLSAGKQVGFRPEATRLEAADYVDTEDLCIPVAVEQSAYLGFAHMQHVTGSHQRFRCLVSQSSMVGERWMMVIPQSALLHVSS